MRVSHVLMFVVDVIAEQDESVMLQMQKTPQVSEPKSEHQKATEYKKYIEHQKATEYKKYIEHQKATEYKKYIEHQKATEYKKYIEHQKATEYKKYIENQKYLAHQKSLKGQNPDDGTSDSNPDDGTSDSNCVTSWLSSCQSPGNWTGSKCCFPDYYSCMPGDADSCTDTWTGWECCKNDQMMDGSADSNCVTSLFLSCQSPGEWTGSKCCFPDHYSCVPGDADSCTDTWTGWECCKDELATTTTTTLDRFVCDKSVNFIVGNYDQIALTDACPDCFANPSYGESMGERYDPNLDGHAVTKALKYCKAECMKRSSCTAFFFQKHGNGHEICGFYSDAVNLASTNMRHHGHQECSQVCIRGTYSVGEYKPKTPTGNETEPVCPDKSIPLTTVASCQEFAGSVGQVLGEAFLPNYPPGCTIRRGQTRHTGVWWNNAEETSWDQHPGFSGEVALACMSW